MYSLKIGYKSPPLSRIFGRSM